MEQPSTTRTPLRSTSLLLKKTPKRILNRIFGSTPSRTLSAPISTTTTTTTATPTRSEVRDSVGVNSITTTTTNTERTAGHLSATTGKTAAAVSASAAKIRTTATLPSSLSWSPWSSPASSSSSSSSSSSLKENIAPQIIRQSTTSTPFIPTATTSSSLDDDSMSSPSRTTIVSSSGYGRQTSSMSPLRYDSPPSSRHSRHLPVHGTLASTDYDSSPECFGGHVAMKSPGMSIPTPSMGYQTRRTLIARSPPRHSDDQGKDSHHGTSHHSRSSHFNSDDNDNNDQNVTTSLVFPHPLRTVRAGASLQNPIVIDEDSFAPSTAQNRKANNASLQDDEVDDDEAFLPDDYLIPATASSAVSSPNRNQYHQSLESSMLFSWDQVQDQIRKANEQLRREIQQDHEQAMQQALEEHLREHATQWKQDADAEYTRLRGLILQEHETAQKHETKANLLQQQYSDMQTQYDQNLEQSQTKEKANNAMVESLQQQVQDLTKELKLMGEQTSSAASLLQDQYKTLETEKASLEEQFKDTQKNLQLRMEQANADTESHHATVQELHIQIADLQQRSKDHETVTTELSRLKTLQQEQQANHEGELGTANATLERIRKETTEEITSLKQMHKQEIKILQSQVDELQVSKDAKEQKYAASMEDFRLQIADSTKKIETLESKALKVSELHQELESQLTTAHAHGVKLQESNHNLESQIQRIKEEHATELNDLNTKARQNLERELTELESKLLENHNQDTTRQVEALGSRAQSDKEEYTRMIRQVREAHNQEIDELLKQLDLIEAENEDKMKKMILLVKEKETVITALGQQLVDAEDKLITNVAEKERLSERLQILDEELAMAKDETESKTKEVKRLIAERAIMAEEEAILREQACADAREEMIQRAEIQFEELNSTYKKLKSKFDEATGRIVVMERDIEHAHRNAEQIQREKEATEVELSNQVAQAKAAATTADLNAARKAKQYRQELQAADELREELQIRLDQAISTSRSIQTTLASVINERELLLAENKDLKAVSEELLEMVEGRQ